MICNFEKYFPKIDFFKKYKDKHHDTINMSDNMLPETVVGLMNGTLSGEDDEQPTVRDFFLEMELIFIMDLEERIVQALQEKFGEFIDHLIENVRRLPFTESTAGGLSTIYYPWLLSDWIIQDPLEFDWSDFLITPREQMEALMRMGLPAQLRELWVEYDGYRRVQSSSLSSLRMILERPVNPNSASVNMQTD